MEIPLAPPLPKGDDMPPAPPSPTGHRPCLSETQAPQGLRTGDVAPDKPDEVRTGDVRGPSQHRLCLNGLASPFLFVKGEGGTEGDRNQTGQSASRQGFRLLRLASAKQWSRNDEGGLKREGKGTRMRSAHVKWAQRSVHQTRPPPGVLGRGTALGGEAWAVNQEGLPHRNVLAQGLAPELGVVVGVGL